jgi:serine/threonine protein kinase
VGKWKFRSPVWQNVSDDAKDFVTRLLTFDPNARPSAHEILSHKWIQKYIELQVTEEQVNASIENLKKFRPL